jgi:YidC/Oxa1 family membrane protein insertase
MELWLLWVAGIRSLLDFLSTGVGLGAGLSIFALTIAMRSILTPLSWSIAYRGAIRHKKMAVLQPQLTRLKDEFGAEPGRFHEKLQQLYAEHGLDVIDGRALVGALAQSPIFIGMYQVLRGTSGGGFLWIQNLAKPDFWFALIVGLTTAMMMAANPDLPENLRLLMIIIPAALAVIMALKFCSALALYMATTNCFSAVQTALLHTVVARRIKSGAIRI